MFDEVPEPVWKTSIGNWSSCSPLGHLVAGAGDPLGHVGVQQAQLGVHARRGGLDAAQPVDHRQRARARRTRGSSRLPCPSPGPKAPAESPCDGGYRAPSRAVAAHPGGAGGFPCSDRQVTALTRIEPVSPPALSPAVERASARAAGPISAEAGAAGLRPLRGGHAAELPREALPGEAVLICTYELAVTAVSEAGEEHLRRPQERPAGHPPARPGDLPARRRSARPPHRAGGPARPRAGRAADAAALRAGRVARHAGRPRDDLRPAARGAASRWSRRASDVADSLNRCKNHCTGCATNVQTGQKSAQDAGAPAENLCKNAFRPQLEGASCD